MLEIFQIFLLTLILPVTLSVLLAQGIFCLMDFLGARSGEVGDCAEESAPQTVQKPVRKAG